MARTRRTILLGEAPGRGFDDRPAFSSKSGVFLSELMGLNVQQTFVCHNLLSEWPGQSSGKGAAFPLAEARAAGEALMKRLHDVPNQQPGEKRRIILAGKRVAKAMRVRPEIDYLTWHTFWLGSTSSWCDEHEFAILPHPSGVNRWWNDRENKAAARRFLLDEARLTGVIPQR